MSNSTLKMIALITMMIDHIGACLFPDQELYRIIGRIAFPIYIFLLVEGYYKTRDVKKYALRLFIFALISEVPFDYARTGDLFRFEYQNVFFTLGLGLLMIWCVDTLERSERPGKEILKAAVLMAFMLAAHLLNTDYRFCGIAVIYVFYRFRSENMDIRQELIKYAFASLVFFACLGKDEMPCVMAFPLIHFYNGKRGMKLKYAFYAFYPFHFACIGVVKTLFPGYFM